MKFKINNCNYFKSDYPDIFIPNENISTNIINIIKGRENQVMIVDEDSNKINSYDIAIISEKVAKGFNLLNFKKEIVGVILPNVVEFIYGTLGALLVGATVSPINPNSTIDEIKGTLSTLYPKIVLINYSNYLRIKEELINLFPKAQKIIVINDDSNEFITTVELPTNINNCPFSIMDFKNLINNDGKYIIENSIVDSKNENAFILFSSGTTGAFKGVQLTHRNSLANVRQIIAGEFAQLNTKQIVLNTLPLFHSFGLTCAFLSLLTFGDGYFILMKKFRLQKFLELLEKERANYAFIVPPVGIELAKSTLAKNYDGSSLRTILSGGAPFPSDVIEILKNRLGVVRDEKGQIVQKNLIVKEGYGLTETSPVISFSSPYKIKYGSSGVLLPNIVAKITDIETGKCLEENQLGQLCVSGPNVMKGYYKKIKATKEAFDNEGFFLTGDIGYFDNEGFLFICDRKKELIKSYGYQVAPAELESILLGHPKIKDVCVIGVKSDRSGEAPKAFIVIKPNEKLNEKEIHEWFNPKVSHYKYLKGGIVFTDIIPKSPSGKILRRLLSDKENIKNPLAKL